jgi:NH3-dependent NAD+ synthetase
MNKYSLVVENDIILAKRLDRLKNISIEMKNGDIYKPPTESEAEEIYSKIIEIASQHLKSTGFKSVVVPASGGADSTFMLKILRDACTLLNKNGEKFPKIIGFTLPCTLQQDSKFLNDMGVWACEMYADDFSTVNIGNIHNYLMENIFDFSSIRMNSGKTLQEISNDINPDYSSREIKVDKGNVAARMRMIFSYGIAKRLGGAQCSTDNISEGLTGFWTLCGDEGTFKYIQCVWKGLEQPILMKIAGIPSPFICQKETDGLGISNGDCEQLFGNLYTGNESYIDVDTVLLNYFCKKEFPDPLNPNVKYSDHPVVLWHTNSEFKRNPFTITRSEIGLEKIPNLNFPS